MEGVGGGFGSRDVRARAEAARPLLRLTTLLTCAPAAAFNSWLTAAGPAAPSLLRLSSSRSGACLSSSRTTWPATSRRRSTTAQRGCAWQRRTWSRCRRWLRGRWSGLMSSSAKPCASARRACAQRCYGAAADSARPGAERAARSTSQQRTPKTPSSSSSSRRRSRLWRCRGTSTSRSSGARGC